MFHITEREQAQERANAAYLGALARQQEDNRDAMRLILWIVALLMIAFLLYIGWSWLNSTCQPGVVLDRNGLRVDRCATWALGR